MAEMNRKKRELALALLEEAAFRGNGYLRLQEAAVIPEIGGIIGRELYRAARIHGLNYSHVTGVSEVGDLMAKEFFKAGQVFGDYLRPILMLNSELNMELVAGDEESDVTTEIIRAQGDRHADRVLLVGDSVTEEAKSEFETIEMLERLGSGVYNILVLVDYEQGESERLEREGYNFHAVFKFQELLELYLAENKIDAIIYDELRISLAANC